MKKKATAYIFMNNETIILFSNPANPVSCLYAFGSMGEAKTMQANQNILGEIVSIDFLELCRIKEQIEKKCRRKISIHVIARQESELGRFMYSKMVDLVEIG